MTNDNKEKQFEKLSFWQLLAKTSVEIPIIQRDYAQGRKNQAKVRDKFLSALSDGLKETVELDFVYGSEEKDTLQPLDGQQRLTTLFLLHWYIATKENKLDENTKKQLSKFTYETRTSSREFCTELVEKGITLEYDEIISDLIKNTAWFVASWKKDPTISAMLIMLDAIHAKFKEESNLWEKLTNEQRITFLYVKLKDFGLSDDLYIKMNARGKQLTHFENFKSQFEKHIEKNEFEKEITNPEDKFTHRIDTVWTDLFWKYKGADGLIDNELVNFIAGVAMNCYAINYTSTKKVDFEKCIQTLANNSSDVTPDNFTKQDYEYLVSCLDKYTENDNDTIKSATDLWDYCERTLFIDFITDKPKSEYKKRTDYYTYPMRVLFFAQTEYLLNNTDQSKFDEWMRVVRNIVENSTIDSATTFISAITLVKELSAGSNDIYNYLSKNKVKAGHAGLQVKEEIEKAKIIVANPDAKQVIHETEDTNFCKGDIDFVLDCIGTFDIDKLTILKNIIKNDLDVNNDITDDFKRAFLTIGDNNYYDVWISWSSSFDCRKRWLLETNSDLVEFAKSNDWKREYLKDLLVQRMSKDFASIADDYTIPISMPKWKEKLIKGTEEIDGATYILFPNPNKGNIIPYCYLAWQQKPSNRNQVTEIK